MTGAEQRGVSVVNRGDANASRTVGAGAAGGGHRQRRQEGAQQWTGIAVVDAPCCR